MKDQLNASSLSRLVDAYQGNGRYVFTRQDALDALRVSRETLRKAAQRLVAKRRLAAPRRGIYVIVPLEYRAAGAPPPSWFIDDLMRLQDRPYYVGLLSAAALHGAAHQQPQELQVVVEAQLRPTVAGRARLRFFAKAGMERTPVKKVKTETGTMRVATPEATALDLLRYPRGAGGLDNVATVLSELAERLDARRLAEAARIEGELAPAQRLGHILERIGAAGATKPLASYVSRKRPRMVRLRPDRPGGRAIRDRRWRILVNERIEAET